MNEIIMNLEVGNDNGNSEHDLVINEKLITQPNIYSRVRKLPHMDEQGVDRLIKKIEDNLIVSVNSPSAEPGIYYIGNYALKSGQRIHNMGVGIENNKTNSDIPIINTLAQIAGYAVQEAYKGNPLLDRKIIVNVDMTTALPVTQYNDDRNEFFKKFTQGIHNVIVHIGALKANVDIKFSFVKILPEAVDVVFYLRSIKKDSTDYDIFKEFNSEYNIEVDGEYFKKKKILHIAIGEGTTEFPITNDIEFDPNFITGTNNGVGHAIENALPTFMEEKRLPTYTRQNYSAVLRDPKHKYYNLANEEVKQPIEDESEDILRTSIGEIGRANNEVDIICVHGGGSILMRENLYQKLKSLGDKSDIKLFYVPTKYAITLEAKGSYEFTKGKLFKMLKEKSINENLKTQAQEEVATSN